ncbi:MAG: hypothetical protein IPJ60_18005 [Sphingobacteriaceae bacterium]|nr:hypothetical protein [Sphingobacteriaceae bacterium]
MLKVNIDGDTYTSIAEQKRHSVIDSIASYYNDGSDPFERTAGFIFLLIICKR